MIEICAVKVANALDTTFEALVSAENEWAQVAGRRRSVANGRLMSTEEAATAAAAAQASFCYDTTEVWDIYVNIFSPFPRTRATSEGSC